MNISNIRLTSIEIAGLWTGYVSDTMSNCVLKYFLKHVKDEDIKAVLQYAYSLTEEHIKKYKDIFQSEKMAILTGFTDEDVNLNAPRLFSDEFFINYIKYMTGVGLTNYSLIYTEVAREDIKQLYGEMINETIILDKKTDEVLLTKGIYHRPPYIPIPNEVDTVERQNFMTGFFGNKRPLTVIEITEIFVNAQTAAFSEALVMAFSQVAMSKEVRNSFIRGKDIAHKHTKILSDILIEEDLVSPTNWNTQILETTESPFSDKLMMFHITNMFGSWMGYYGTGIAASQRRDLGAMYFRLMAEVSAFCEDGVNILIKHGWLEQPPTAPNRKTIAKGKK